MLRTPELAQASVRSCSFTQPLSGIPKSTVIFEFHCMSDAGKYEDTAIACQGTLDAMLLREERYLQMYIWVSNFLFLPMQG